MSKLEEFKGDPILKAVIIERWADAHANLPLPGKVVSRKRMWLFGATKRQASALELRRAF